MNNNEVTLFNIGDTAALSGAAEVVLCLLHDTNTAKEPKQFDFSADLEDVHEVMRATGISVFGRARAQGANRATETAEALISLFTQNRQDTANSPKAILHFSTGVDQELEVEEMTLITEHLTDALLREAELIFSHNKDASLGDAIHVSLLAAVP